MEDKLMPWQECRYREQLLQTWEYIEASGWGNRIEGVYENYISIALQVTKESRRLRAYREHIIFTKSTFPELKFNYRRIKRHNLIAEMRQHVTGTE